MANGHGNLLYTSSLNSIIGDLSTWRVDTFIRQLEKQKAKGRILPFVRGLRLSALLIYQIRKILPSSIFADWGHILDDSGTLVSSEADIIIHTGHYQQWDGYENPVMNFKFVERRNAKLVISCKSYLKKNEIDRNYCNDMKNFVSRIWLFAECCGPKSVKKIEQEITKYGYERFWYLYTWSLKSDISNNTQGWRSFIEEVKKIN